MPIETPWPAGKTVEILGRAAEMDPADARIGQNLHENAHHWVYYAGLVASWVIFRTIRTALVIEQWQGLWNPVVIGAWSLVVVGIAFVVIRRRRQSLPSNAQELLDEVARRTRASRRRNAIFDGAMFIAFFGGMLWAIDRYEAPGNSIGLRAAMFLALLAVGFAAGKLFRRVTGSIEG